MFSEYIYKLKSNGMSYFTSEEIRSELALSDSATRPGLYRLKKAQSALPKEKRTRFI